MNEFVKPILGRARVYLVVSIITGAVSVLGTWIFWSPGMDAMVKLTFPWFFVALVGVPLMGAISGLYALGGLLLLYTCRAIRRKILFTIEEQEMRRIQRAAKEMRERLKIGNEGRDQVRILMQEVAVALTAGVRFSTTKKYVERAVHGTALTYEISNLGKLLDAGTTSAYEAKGVLKLTWKSKSGENNEYPIELWFRQVSDPGPIK